MRLINTRDLFFKEFLGSRIPPYAVISHRWIDDEETTHQEYLNGKRHGCGWKKVKKGCEIARSRGHEWLWIDTICIDSKSSAELSEAINSMFRWYKQSKECYVFLPDVYNTSDCDCADQVDAAESNDSHRLKKSGGVNESDNPTGMRISGEICSRQFTKSSWFQRGWTLQELLAPRNVLFFNAHFEYFGTKADLDTAIGGITGISSGYLTNSLPIKWASVAQRMGWASGRVTTREEDIAYSLLGIFDVNMPLIYGEGSKAFTRLQIEIIRKSSDESIFAWWSSEPEWLGLLAQSPRAFDNSLLVDRGHFINRGHFEMTNQGLRFSFRSHENLQSVVGQTVHVRLLLPLNCVIGLSRRRAHDDQDVSIGHRNIAIKATARISSHERIITAYRVHGSTTKSSLIVEETGTSVFKPSSFKFDQSNFDDGFKPSGTEVKTIIVQATDKASTEGEEWQLYFPQSGM